MTRPQLVNVHISFFHRMQEGRKNAVRSGSICSLSWRSKYSQMIFTVTNIAFTHIVDGKVKKAKLIHRPCPAGIRIWSPNDINHRRAIVIVKGPHNHPKPPATKVTREGKDLYEKAAEASGLNGLTVGKLDNGTDRLTRKCHVS